MIGTVANTKSIAIYIGPSEILLEFASILYRKIERKYYRDRSIFRFQVSRQKNYKIRTRIEEERKKGKERKKEEHRFDEKSSSEMNLARCKLPNRYVSNHKLNKKGLCNYA